MTQETPQESSFGERLCSAIAALFRGLIRLIAILTAITAIVILIYLLPRLNWIIPGYSEQEQARSQELDAQQTASSQMIENEFRILRERVLVLELQNDAEKQAFDEIKAELDTTFQTQQDQLEALTSTQTAASQTLGEINASQEEIEQKITRLSNALNQLSGDLQTLETQTAKFDHQLSAAESPIMVLQSDLVLLKAMEMLTRSRLYLVQNNLGLAESEVQAARDLLAAMIVPDYQQAALKAILTRLDLALLDLPHAPILAAEDLEIAWQLLRTGLPRPAGTTATVEPSAVNENQTPTPAPQVTNESSSTPTP